MNDKVLIVDDYSKPAEEVLKTAIRKGVTTLVIADIPFDMATTAADRSDYLREVVFHINDADPTAKLKLKECRIVKGEFSDMDSTNLSHAGAYYKIWIELPRRVVVGTPLEETMEELTESEAIIGNYPDGECPDCYRLIPKNVKNGQACKNCEHVFYAP